MLDNISTGKHLGVLFSSKLLGFMKKWCKEFHDPYKTKRLHMALVRLTLEYASVISVPIGR